MQMLSLSHQQILKQLSHCHVFSKRDDGRYLTANQTMCDDLGLADEQNIINRSDTDFVWRNYAQCLQRNDRAVRSFAKAERFVEPVVLANGRQVKLLSAKFPLLNRQQNVVGVYGISMVDHVGNSCNLWSELQRQCLEGLLTGASLLDLSLRLNVSVSILHVSLEQTKERLGCRSVQELLQLYQLLKAVYLPEHHNYGVLIEELSF